MSDPSKVLPSENEFEDSWSNSVTADLKKSRSRAWLVAGAAALIAVLEAIALASLMPLRTVEPYTLLVDRQTGHVEALAPLDTQVIEPDEALVRSFLVQYVIARESFAIDSLQDDYRKVALWTAGPERARYQRLVSADNPVSALASLPTRAIIRTEIKSVSILNPDRALVRFMTTRADPGSEEQQSQHWVAIIRFGFSDAEMSAEDRYINPLGFQVTSYRRDPETIIEPDALPPAPQLPPRDQP